MQGELTDHEHFILLVQHLRKRIFRRISSLVPANQIELTLLSHGLFVSSLAQSLMFRIFLDLRTNGT